MLAYRFASILDGGVGGGGDSMWTGQAKYAMEYVLGANEQPKSTLWIPGAPTVGINKMMKCCPEAVLEWPATEQTGRMLDCNCFRRCSVGIVFKFGTVSGSCYLNKTVH